MSISIISDHIIMLRQNFIIIRVSRILGKRERNGNGKRERKQPTENA